MTLTSVVIGANSFLGQEIISKELLLNNKVFINRIFTKSEILLCKKINDKTNGL